MTTPGRKQSTRLAADAGECPQDGDPLLPPEVSIPVRLASLESAFHSAPIGLCTVDLDFRYIVVNELFARMYDKSAGYLVGSSLMDAPSDLVPQLLSHYAEALKTQRIVEREITVQKSGVNPGNPSRELIYLRSAQPVRDPSGTIIGISVALLDITERRQIERALRESEENLRYTVELTPHIPWTADANGDMTFLSPRWFQMTGIRPSPAQLRNWILRLHPGDRKRTLEIWKKSVASGDTFDTDYRVRSIQGEWRWHRARAYPRRNERAEIILWYGTVEDIHDRKLAEAALQAKTERLEEATAKLSHLARKDHLTGLANRRTFDDTLVKEIERSRRSGLPLALILADVDHFKRLNDEYGHHAGDEVLRAVAQTLEGVLRRPGDLAARFGGEEFTILLPNTTAEGALMLAEKARRAVASLLFPHLDTQPRGVTISLGLAMLPLGHNPAETREDLATDLLDVADKALYRAKGAGRNRVVFT